MSTVHKSAALLKELDALNSELPNGIHPEDLRDRVARLRKLALQVFRRLGDRVGMNTAEPGAGGVNATQKSVRRFRMSEIEAGTIRKAETATDPEPAPQPTWSDLAAAFARHHHVDLES